MAALEPPPSVFILGCYRRRKGRRCTHERVCVCVCVCVSKAYILLTFSSLRGSERDRRGYVYVDIQSQPHVCLQ